MSGSYKDLRAWRQAVDLALQLHVYHCTRMFPKDELYGLTSQMRMAAVSVASNIAEGKGRSSDKELIAFLHYARGSLLELAMRESQNSELALVQPRVQER